MKIQEVIKDIKPGIVFILTRFDTKLSIKGTGFIVRKDGLILSCAHVFDDTPVAERENFKVGVWQTSEKGVDRWKESNLKFLTEDKVHDLALFRFKPESNLKPLDLGNSEMVEEGDNVLFTGFPIPLDFVRMNMGITLATKSMIISAIKRRNSDKTIDFFQLDTHVNKGFSGSPVVKLDDGKVVGITSGHFNNVIKINGQDIEIPHMMGIARPINPAFDLIRKNSK